MQNTLLTILQDMKRILDTPTYSTTTINNSIDNLLFVNDIQVRSS